MDDRQSSMHGGRVGPGRAHLVLSAALLALAAGGALCVWNWPRLSPALERQSSEARATLFRLGELSSIRAALADEFGAAPKLDYRTEGGSRILKIAFEDSAELAGGRRAAHRIAAAAWQTTEKPEQVDRVEVRLRGASFVFLAAEVHAPYRNPGSGADPKADREATKTAARIVP